jgi:DNA-directed RNA polymerase specialized sigma24 family protein
VNRRVQMEPRSESIEPTLLPELCEDLRPQLRVIFWRYRVPPPDTEDVLQTCLLRALIQWEEIHDPRAWLLRTVVNRCVMYWRDRRRRDRRSIACAGLPALRRRQAS